ncbi:MAG: arylsulfatase [Bacteroides sp.]|nr:arylsulfatase [Bacteroides sp.]
MKRKKQIRISVIFLLMFSGIWTTAIAQELYMDNDQLKMDRTVLPIKEPTPPIITEMDARNVKPPQLFKVSAPKDAPNVIIIMLDDLGYAGTSAFGGIVKTPTFDKLANQGLRYTHFHSTAQCASTRIALNTGRNHHSCSTGIVGEMSTSFPGYNGKLSNSIAPLAKTLKYNGYNTAAFGKWHLTEIYDINTSGPYDNWPVGMGYEYFYGFMGGETNQWSPALYENMNPIDVPETPGYHFMNDMTSKAIEWMHKQQSFTPDKPFFMYFTPGAVHAPHHVPEEYIKKHKGEFDEGWDVMRETIFKKQKELGVIPKDAKLADKAPVVKDWDKLTKQEQEMFAHQAEVFAAYLDMADTEIGRLVQTLEDDGILDNTLILYIAGDNGTSAEGTQFGTYNENFLFNGVPADFDRVVEHNDEWGGPTTYPHMASGWAVAFDTPFSYFKQVASNYGGTRQGMAVHWPAQIKAKGELRHQWHHVIDVAPTILEAIGLPEPTVVDGIPQHAIEGTSMAYTFHEPDAADRHLVQYFEMFGNRGIYYDGWFAGTVHFYPGAEVLGPTPKLTEDKWELYNVEKDFSMATNLAGEYPDKLAELQDMFEGEALKYNVFPLDDRIAERFNPTTAGRPTVLGDRKYQTFHEGAGFIGESSFIDIKNQSWEAEAIVETEGKKANGVIVHQGGYFGGWSLYLKEGTPIFHYNWFGAEQYSIKADSKLPAGKCTIKMDFAYEGTKPGAGGTVTLYVNDKKVGTGKVDKTEPSIFSADETSNIGVDRESMVTTDYTHETSKFNGKIDKVTISQK